jgi:hypothetical protein
MIVLELYRRGSISSGKAAERRPSCSACREWSSFATASRLGIPHIDMTRDECEAEKAILNGPGRSGHESVIAPQQIGHLVVLKSLIVEVRISIRRASRSGLEPVPENRGKSPSAVWPTWCWTSFEAPFWVVGQFELSGDTLGWLRPGQLKHSHEHKGEADDQPRTRDGHH